jgi:hypothetical protein
MDDLKVVLDEYKDCAVVYIAFKETGSKFPVKIFHDEYPGHDFCLTAYHYAYKLSGFLGVDFQHIPFN